GAGGSGATNGTAGTANATSSATAVGGQASAQAVASGASAEQAQATAQTKFGNFASVQATSTSPVSGSNIPATAITQAGGFISLTNALIAGQSFSVVSGSGSPVTVANGFMGAGAAGGSPHHPVSVSFTQNGGIFALVLLSSDALGNGFDSAFFEILLNGILIDAQSFTDLASAEAFFSANLINVPLLAGPNSVQILFNETMSGSEGF